MVGNGNFFFKLIGEKYNYILYFFKNIIDILEIFFFIYIVLL